jgi:RNA polymerase sigma-70 factor (ECF subfamily)
LEAAWRSGSRPAFAELFRRHYAAVAAYARRFTGDTALAEDVAQQAFLNVLQRRNMPGRGRFKSLIYTVTRNLALNERRRRGRKYVARSGLDEVEPGVVGPHPLGAMIRSEEEDAFRVAVAGLPPVEREAFCLRETRGLTYAEVGRIMGLHPDAVRRRVAKAIDLIRGTLKAGDLL